MSEAYLAVRAVDLSKRFGDVVAVDRLSLDVRRGEVLAVLGPNGAGKTTTLRRCAASCAPTPARSSSTAGRSALSPGRATRRLAWRRRSW